MRLLRQLTMVAALTAALMSHLPAMGHAAAPAPPPRPTAEDLGALIDPIIERQVRDPGLPGAAVAVVHDGKLLFARGYGVADTAGGVPVDPERTGFRTGSVAKLFTATAVMQLVEQGRLDLDADVNGYLRGVQVPDTFPGRPVTLAHLLTHTAGFAEQIAGIFAQDPGDLKPLVEVVRDGLPLRVRPPGELAAYSNQGVALAGLVVEQVSGESYADYVRQHVFDPLGMTRTTLTQPLDLPPAELSPGYSFVDDKAYPEPFELIAMTPAGAATAPVTDMAPFMIAHLAEGELEQGRMLEAETAREMHRRQFSHHPDLDGMTYGFIERDLHGQRLLTHGGDTQWTHTQLALAPDLDLGVYVAYNGTTAEGSPRNELVEAVLGRYAAGAEAPAGPAGSSGTADVNRFAGAYLTTRSPHEGLERLTNTNQLRLSAEPDGTLTSSQTLTNESLDSQRWAPVSVPGGTGEAIFHEVGGTDRIVFRLDDRGQPVHLAADNRPIQAFERLPWYRDSLVHGIAAAAATAVFLVVALLWPLCALVAGRRRHRRGAVPSSPRERRTRVLLWSVAVLLPGATIAVLLILSTDPTNLYYGETPVLSATLTLLVASILLGLTSLPAVVVAWVRGYWSRPARLLALLHSVAVLAFVAVLAVYGLAGFPFSAQVG